MKMNFIERLRSLLSGEGHHQDGPRETEEECTDCRPISCGEALEKVYEYLDGELDGATNRDVQHHFSVCKRCYPHLQLEERFLDLLHESKEEVTMPAHLKDQVLELLALEAAQKE
jgi:mycothiol system anti-sigma-R factor